MLETAIEATRQVGQILLEEFGRSQEISFKGLRDIVTEADLAAQAKAVEVIRSRYPDHDIWAEEVGQTPDGASDYCWIVDPLDGTTNYSRGFPCFSVSIALSHRGELILGVVYDPLRDQLFRAQRGQGAYLNDDRIQVSAAERLIDAVIGLDWAHEQELRCQMAQLVAEVAPKVGTLRSTGSAALGLCSMAAGWIDVYFHLSLKPWDVAAASVIIQEAGGTISDLVGLPWHPKSGSCLASNGLIHKAMLTLLTGT
ncbi:MAG: inositol monophosphatase [Anaerolineales bacterium]|nr:inositol monophosphatase [Anaerolineales bacterium]